MKRRLLPIPTGNRDGFTLLEIAIVMVIIGILTGGGISLMKLLTERKARNETAEYLQQARAALISYATANGRLPWADNNGDGAMDNGAAIGTLPYLTLQIAPSDAYTRILRYELNANLAASRPGTCAALRAGLAVRPLVVDADGVPTAFSVAAALVSAGPTDADSNGNVFDALNAGTHAGNNVNGNPNYLRHPPVITFDDLTTYIGGNELFGHMCEFLSLAVNNASAAAVYVFDMNQASDLGSITAGNSALYNIISGTRIVLRSAPGGGGAIVSPTTPQTPVVLAGRGETINIP